MKRKVFNITLFVIFLGGLLAMFLSIVGCSHTDIIVPYDAPLQLSQDETIHQPYAWLDGKWTKTGDVTRHQGATVLLIPAMQSAAK